MIRSRDEARKWCVFWRILPLQKCYLHLSILCEDVYLTEKLNKLGCVSLKYRRPTHGLYDKLSSQWFWETQPWLITSLWYLTFRCVQSQIYQKGSVLKNIYCGFQKRDSLTGLVPIPRLAVYALVYIHDGFPEFDQSESSIPVCWVIKKSCTISSSLAESEW